MAAAAIRGPRLRERFRLKFFLESPALIPPSCVPLRALSFIGARYARKSTVYGRCAMRCSTWRNTACGTETWRCVTCSPLPSIRGCGTQCASRFATMVWRPKAGAQLAGLRGPVSGFALRAALIKSGREGCHYRHQKRLPPARPLFAWAVRGHGLLLIIFIANSVGVLSIGLLLTVP